VLERFTWARAAEGTVARYREAIAGAGPRHTSVAPAAASPLVGNHRLGIVYNNKRFPRRIIICLLERVHSYLIITL